VEARRVLLLLPIEYSFRYVQMREFSQPVLGMAISRFVPAGSLALTQHGPDFRLWQKRR
jgi:hypothetical protein